MAEDGESGRRRRVGTAVTALGTLVSVVGGTAGLVFLFAPDLRPCLGSASASFGDAPVVPRVSFREHRIRQGASFAEARRQPDTVGAEVRFTFETDGYRDKELPVTWTLFYVDRAGVLDAVVPGQDRALAMTVKPAHCADKGGYDLFVPIPDQKRRYRVMLELFRDRRLDERLDLVETEVFHG